MSLVRSSARRGWALLLGACFLCSWWPILVHGARNPPRYTTDAKDLADCKLHLNKIYGAIQKYREEHKNEYPEKLSDLTPDYIHDPSVLVCPFVEKRGGMRTWKKQFRDFSADPYTSYSYEFAPVQVDEFMWRGVPRKTWREFKQRVMQEVGAGVPIVRCLDHRPQLNLASDGEIYESGEYWERNFAPDEQSFERLTSLPQLFAVPEGRRLSAADFPPRDPRADARLLDLSDFYNASLTNGWQGFPGNHLGGLTPGIREFGGVRFDVRGVIQLRGTDLPAEFPTNVPGVKVGQKCSRIHFLHATSFTYTMGATTGFYVVRYANGQALEIPLIYGQHLADWWRVSKRSVTPTDAKVAWTGENEAAKAFGKTLALYQSSWDNPNPDVEVMTIDFETNRRRYLAGSFAIAITLE